MVAVCEGMGVREGVKRGQGGGGREMSAEVGDAFAAFAAREGCGGGCVEVGLLVCEIAGGAA